ncbi:MAG: DUF4834 family protein [Bacteroides sp.]|nr:DUF4834 family protein [Roseburia sp.]MCM1347541.1 DUF4834 family protein [Bacteroides sp.]MCM1421984.1 DUF4834 family protein [Bacteroides sp.]
MLHFLGFILLLFLLFIIGIGLFASAVMRKIFGGTGNTQSADNKSRNGFSGRNEKSRNSQKSGRKNNKKKIFTEDEGTYVDFVEVKE